MKYTELKEGIESIGKDGVREVLESIGLDESRRLVKAGTTLEEIKDAIEEHGEDVVKAAIACDVQLEDIGEAYQGHFRDDEDFAQNMAEQLGDYNPKAGWPHNCIDWEFAARELMYDYSSENGHYFRNL